MLPFLAKVFCLSGAITSLILAWFDPSETEMQKTLGVGIAFCVIFVILQLFFPED